MTLGIFPRWKYRIGFVGSQLATQATGADQTGRQDMKEEEQQ